MNTVEIEFFDIVEDMYGNEYHKYNLYINNQYIKTYMTTTDKTEQEIINNWNNKINN